MFERRLRVLLVLLGVFTLAIVVRLVDLQLVRAGQYREQLAARMKPRPQWFPFVRGRILDREGNVLVQDSPTWELCVDYKIIAFDDYRERLVTWWSRRKTWWSRRKRYEDYLQISKRPDETRSSLRLRISAKLHSRIAEMWRDIKVFAQVHDLGDPEEIVSRAEVVVDRVDKIRTGRIKRRGYGESQKNREIVVREENGVHPIVKGLNQKLQVLARGRFAAYPWVHIRPSSARTYAPNTKSFAHVLGRVGRVGEDYQKHDPNRGDDLSEYHDSDFRGVSGVEYVAEQRLRGRRGRLLEARSGAPIDEVAAERGEDVSLTISGDLQRALYGLMQEAKMSDGTPVRSGAIVVLDVPTREVLALVSYPAYEPSKFSEDYDELRDDMIGAPLRFRAVANRYAPGSILKPLVGLCGLSTGVIDLNTRFTCEGAMDPAHPLRDRCWLSAATGRRKHHGSLNLEEAIRGSCNIFMYHVGDSIGDVDTMCDYFDMFGLGKCSGTGLLEESCGINPTSDYLIGIGRHVVPAHLRQFSIGQGEIAVTPVQAANVMATYAVGRFKPVTLIRGEETLEWTLPGSPADWSAIRQGMYDVVNDPGGTAYHHARLENDSYVLCGKTGSATVYAQPILYRIAYEKADGSVGIEKVPGRAPQSAIDRFEAEYPERKRIEGRVEAVEWWPPVPDAATRAETHFAHAWFGAFLQRRGADGGPDWSVPPRIAFAVLVEYGGSGGHVAGPLAERVAAKIIERLGPGLES